MVLYVNATLVDKDPDSVEEMFERYPQLKKASVPVVTTPPRVLKHQDKLVYACQREMIVTHPGNQSVSIIGTEDATTCHVIVLREPSTGATGIAHFDSAEQDELDIFVKHLKDLVIVLTEKCDQDTKLSFQTSILAGYQDEKDTSEELSLSLLALMMEDELTRFDLSLFCVGSVNTRSEKGVNWPILYGAGCDVSSGDVFHATFPYHGPDTAIRSMRMHSSNPQLLSIYNCHTNKIIIPPFNCRPINDVDMWLKQSDAFLLKYMSTSPEVEPARFCNDLRAMFRKMMDHPEPRNTLFRGNEPRVYGFGEKGWELEGQEEEEACQGEKKREFGVADFMRSMSK